MLVGPLVQVDPLLAASGQLIPGPQGLGLGLCLVLSYRGGLQHEFLPSLHLVGASYPGYTLHEVPVGRHGPGF